MQPKITMTLLVRNEADILEDNIRFHHAMGVDSFIVMDNLSTDFDTADPGSSGPRDPDHHFAPGTGRLQPVGLGHRYGASSGTRPRGRLGDQQ